MTQVARGEVWLADLDPIIGSEQAGLRPILIVTTDMLNNTPNADVFAVPITTRDKKLRSRIPIHGGEGGLSEDSFIMCDKMRSISRLRLKKKFGRVSDETLTRVTEILAWLIGLEV